MQTNSNFLFFTSGEFSNWYPSAFSAPVFPGSALMDFNTGEQHMMVCKALVFHDYSIIDKLMNTNDPREQKALGRKVKHFDAAHWRQVCEQLFYPGLYAKFTQDDQLKQTILATDDLILVEAAPWDKIWGIGMAATDPGVEDPTNWKGTNLLGNMLMNVRSHIKVQSGK